MTLETKNIVYKEGKNFWFDESKTINSEYLDRLKGISELDRQKLLVGEWIPDEHTADSQSE